MLPLSLLRAGTGGEGSPLLVELKSGETYNGRLVSCDAWMNMNLREVICTSKDGDRFWKLPVCYIRGSAVKYLRLPPELMDKAMELEEQQSHQQQQQQSQYTSRGGGGGRGRGRGEGRGGRNYDGRGRGRGGRGGRGGGRVGGGGGGRGRTADGGGRGGGRGRGRDETSS